MTTVLHDIYTDHEDKINDAQLDFYGVRLATCSSDGTVRIFDIVDGQYVPIATFKEHKGPVWRVSWSHPACRKMLASCSCDGTVVIWEEETDGEWMKIYKYEEHSGTVYTTCWSPGDYGNILISASADGDISVITCLENDLDWHVFKIKEAHSRRRVHALDWEPPYVTDKRILYPTYGRKPGISYDVNIPIRFVSGGEDNLLKIWKSKLITDWEVQYILEGHSSYIRDVAWAPCIGAAQNMIASCTQVILRKL